VGWNQPVDQLNAAQSGALASNLLHEVRGPLQISQYQPWLNMAVACLDYLVPRVKALNIAASRYKYLSLQIGSNDLCQLCLAGEL
jgi:phospholipase B1